MRSFEPESRITISDASPATLAVEGGSAGGLLMGWGGLLIPGGNDGLILLGMPMLWLYAWVSFGVMVVVIATALKALAPR